MNITNVAVDGTANGQRCIGWQLKGISYHVWLDEQHRPQPALGRSASGPVIYKRVPGAKDVTYLKLSIAKNKLMFDDAMAEAVAQHLFEKHDEALAAQERQHLAQAAEEYKVTLAQQAGPKLLAALHDVRKYLADADDALDLGQLQTLIDDAIADAEQGPEVPKP